MSATTLANLGVLIKAKRREKKIGLRSAADESGVSASTLSRLERGIFASSPDTETLQNISAWLGISLSKLVDEGSKKTEKMPRLNTTEFIEVHLRADKNLTPESAEALSLAFKLLYKQFTSKKRESR